MAPSNFLVLFKWPGNDHVLSSDLYLKLSLPQGYEANLHPLLVIVWVLKCHKTPDLTKHLSAVSQPVTSNTELQSPQQIILFVSLFRDGVPGRQSVTEEFSLDWPQVLSSAQHVALAWVDGRSGVGRGQKTTALDSRKLGSLRAKDYLAVIE